MSVASNHTKSNLPQLVVDHEQGKTLEAVDARNNPLTRMCKPGKWRGRSAGSAVQGLRSRASTELAAKRPHSACSRGA